MARKCRLGLVVLVVARFAGLGSIGTLATFATTLRRRFVALALLPQRRVLVRGSARVEEGLAREAALPEGQRALRSEREGGDLLEVVEQQRLALVVRQQREPATRGRRPLLSSCSSPGHA